MGLCGMVAGEIAPRRKLSKRFVSGCVPFEDLMILCSGHGAWSRNPRLLSVRVNRDHPTDMVGTPPYPKHMEEIETAIIFLSLCIESAPRIGGYEV